MIHDLRVFRGDPGIPDEEVQALWRQLFLYYVPRLRHALAARANDEDELKDLVQTAWSAAFYARDSYRATGPFSHWLLTIALRTSGKHIGNEIARRERLQKMGDPIRESEQAAELQELEKSLDLESALERLTERERDHFRMAREGYTAEEIQRALGYASLAAVWQGMSRLKAKLTAFLR